MGNYKCVIPWKPLVVQRNRPKFGPEGGTFTVVYIMYRVLLTVKCSSSVWCHSVHFQFSLILYMLYLGNG